MKKRVNMEAQKRLAALKRRHASLARQLKATESEIRHAELAMSRAAP